MKEPLSKFQKFVGMKNVKKYYKSNIILFIKFR